jgi:hypothetical protein
VMRDGTVGFVSLGGDEIRYLTRCSVGADLRHPAAHAHHPFRDVTTTYAFINDNGIQMHMYMKVYW